MARLSSSQKVQKRLVENITLLWALYETPDQPKENELHGGYDQDRQLPLDRERQLVDSFAFISASTDDMLRVMAVSIEEDPDKIGMTIRLASNTGDLSLVMQGFNSIARTLEEASLRAKSRFDVRQDLFHQIIMLDEPRILSRLRSTHAARSRKTIGKPALLPLLSSTIEDALIHSYCETTSTNLTCLRSSSKQLSETFSDFEAARQSDIKNNASHDILLDLLTRISEFDVSSLQTFLASAHSLDPSLKTYLPLAMSKLGHYYFVTCDLVDAARSSQNMLFRRISVQATGTPRLDMAFMAGRSAGFDQTLQRVTRSSPNYRHTDYDPRSVSAVQTKFHSRMTGCTTPWKVHAEIQLLLFYEQEQHIRRPRIIDSSKSACYLCHSFIRHHGKFQVPRSHGRLYDRWMLPEWPVTNLRSVVDKLNAALEAKIIYILNHKRLPLSQPAESVLGFGEPWSSYSTLSKAYSRRSVHEATDYVSIAPSKDPQDARCDASSCSLPSTITSAERVKFGIELCPDSKHAEIPLPQPTTTLRHLSRGTSTCCELNDQHDVLIVQTDVGRIYASWDIQSVAITSDLCTPSHACWVQVTWLAKDDQTIQSNERLEFFNIQSLAPNHDHVVEDGAALSSKELTLQIKGHTILIKYTFEDPGGCIKNGATGG
ncbi:MAG: hypothetical protein Q9171_002268 [Xanthocarpia ochracea]